MKLSRIIELLKIEHECMLRGSHNDCDRKCENCELVQDDYELHEMYMNVILMLEKKYKKTHKSRRKYKIYVCVTNEFLKDVAQEHISVGTVWKRTKPMLSENSIRLVSVGDNIWCEIPKETFKKCFRKAVIYE